MKLFKITAFTLLIQVGLTTFAVAANCPPLREIIPSTAELDQKFTQKATDLTPGELAAISEMAQAKDLSKDPVDKEADKLSKQLIHDLQTRSSQTYARLSTLAKRHQQKVYDTVVVGAGIHGAELATVVESLKPGTEILGIDAGDGTHAVFDSDFFHLNSSNGPELDDTPLLYSPNQLRDLMPDAEGHVYPRARALANGNHSAVAAIRSDVLLKEKVISAQKDADGMFTVKTSSGLTVRARKLVSAMGYGSTKTGFLDADSQALVKELTTDFRNGKTQGVIMPFDDYRQKVERDRIAAVKLAKKNRLPLDESYDHVLDSKDKLLVGGGDGGAVVAEHETIHRDGKKLDWLGQSGANGADYIAGVGNKKRYGDLVTEIDHDKVNPIPGHLTKLRKIKVDGMDKIEATYTEPDGTQKILVKDVVILSTGYNPVDNVFGNMVPRYFSNTNDPELKGVWDLAKTREAKFYENNPGVQGTETPGFYSVGVYGFKATGMPSVSPGTGVTVQIAKEIAADVQITRPVSKIAEAAGAQTSISTMMTSGRQIKIPKIALAGAKVQLLRESRAFAFGSDLNLAVKYRAGKITLQIDGLAPEASAALLKNLQNNKAFIAYLSDYRTAGGKSISFHVPITEGGGLRMDKIAIAR